MNHPIKFLDGDNKKKLVPASFSDFLELLWEMIRSVYIASRTYRFCRQNPIMLV